MGSFSRWVSRTSSPFSSTASLIIAFTYSHTVLAIPQEEKGGDTWQSTLRCVQLDPDCRPCHSSTTPIRQYRSVQVTTTDWTESGPCCAAKPRCKDECRSSGSRFTRSGPRAMESTAISLEIVSVRGRSEVGYDRAGTRESYLCLRLTDIVDDSIVPRHTKSCGIMLSYRLAVRLFLDPRWFGPPCQHRRDHKRS